MQPQIRIEQCAHQPLAQLFSSMDVLFRLKTARDHSHGLLTGSQAAKRVQGVVDFIYISANLMLIITLIAKGVLKLQN